MSTTAESATPEAQGDETSKRPTTTERLAEAAHEVIDETAAKAEGVERQLRDRAEAAGQKVEASQEAATEQVERAIARAETFVNERPVAAAGIAFAAGVLTTALLRR